MGVYSWTLCQLCYKLTFQFNYMQKEHNLNRFKTPYSVNPSIFFQISVDPAVSVCEKEHSILTPYKHIVLQFNRVLISGSLLTFFSYFLYFKYLNIIEKINKYFSSCFAGFKICIQTEIELSGISRQF